MKPVDPHAFERKSTEAKVALDGDKPFMIRTTMNRSDWLILLTLAVIWGGAFFFIGVAVRHVPPSSGYDGPLPLEYQHTSPLPHWIAEAGE